MPLMFLGFVLAWFLREIPLRETVGPARPAAAARGDEPTIEAAGSREDADADADVEPNLV